MPRYAYQKPRARMYGYNLDYYKNYYKPMSHFIEAENKDVTEKPGAQTLAERRRCWLVDPVWFPSPWEWDCIWVPPHENRSWPHFGVESYRQLILKYLELRNRRYKIQVKLCPIHRHLLDNGLDEVLTVDNVVV